MTTYLLLASNVLLLGALALAVRRAARMHALATVNADGWREAAAGWVDAVAAHRRTLARLDRPVRTVTVQSLPPRSQWGQA